MSTKPSVSLYRIRQSQLGGIVSQVSTVSPYDDIPFWCGNKHLHVQRPDTYREIGCCTNHVIGLPVHPAKNKMMPITPYQNEFAQLVDKTRRKAGNGPVKIHYLKGRQMGCTEIVMRYIIHHSTHRYAGWNVGLMAGNNGQLARKNLARLHLMLHDSAYADLEESYTGNLIHLANGTRIEAFAASEEAMTGDTRYKCVHLDEAAKWKLIDDTPVLNSVLPIVNTNGADLFLTSTPKGRIKNFYKIWKEKPPGWTFLEHDIWRSEGNMHTKAEIDKLLSNPAEDPEQEYLCKFTTSAQSVFGAITDEMRYEDDGEAWDI